jgi:hypothetical protein
MFVDPAKHTMSTLYSDTKTLALVTWQQRDDPHWFGGSIPDKTVSVETVELATSTYRNFGATSSTPERRKAFILALTPAKLP